MSLSSFLFTHPRTPQLQSSPISDAPAQKAAAHDTHRNTRSSFFKLWSKDFARQKANEVVRPELKPNKAIVILILSP